MASDGTIKISTELDTSTAKKAMSQFSSVAGKGFSAVKTAAKVSAEAVAVVGTGLLAAGGYAIKVGAEFEAGMSQVQAISGATAAEMEKLTEKAKEMGAKTKFSAAESAEAFNYMAMAGWKTEDMLGGIEGIMNLAAASGEDLATTSDIVTDALTAFGMSASDSGHFADVLAQASSNANTNVAMMGETFKYVGAVAGTFGYNVEDTALAIGLMANSGIKASQAGTTLRGALTRLVKPTDDMQQTMIDLGLAVEEVEHVVSSSQVDKLQGKVADKTAAMEKAQISYNSAVAKYGAESAQAQKAAINLETAQRALADASNGLTSAQAGSNQVVGVQNVLLTDAEGNTRSFRDVIIKLRESFKGMTQEQQAQAAATLFGQEAMSGMLAIINASDEDFNKLAESIDNADGSAADMAETMQDNLIGQLTILKSSVEGLGNEIYEGMEEPLKEAAKVGIGYVNQLTDAFKEGGLEGVVKEAGNIFGELATNAAQQAPQMVNAAVDFIRAFAEGIYANRAELVEAAKDIVFTFAGGLAKLLPKSVSKPVRDAIQAINKSLNSGGLKKASGNFINVMGKIGDATGELTKKVLPAFVEILDFAGENLDLLAASVTICVTAYKGMDVINGISATMKTASGMFQAASLAVDAYNSKVLIATLCGQTANATLTLSQAAVGVLTGKISAATLVHTAWNAVMNANPIGIVITAVAALAAGIAVYKLTTEDVVTAEEMQAQRLQEISDKVSEQKTKWEELEQAKQEQLDADLALVDHTQDLWNELQTIVDANGKVKEGYEDRAAFITGELSEALGVELEYIDKEVKGLDEVGQSIDTLIEKKKAQIILDANAAQYAEAIQKTREMEMAQAEAKRELDEQQNAVTEKQIELSKLQAEALASNKVSEIENITAKTAALREETEQEEKNLSEKQQLYNDATNTVADYYKTVTDYENLSTAIIGENSAEIQAAIGAITTSRKTATTEDATEMAIQLLNQREHIALLREEMDAGMKGVTEDKIKNAEDELVKMQAEYDKATSNLDEHTKSVAGLMDKLTGDMTQDEAEQLAVWLGMVSDAEMNGREISDEAKLMVDTVLENFDEMPEQTRETMKNAMKPMYEEMEASEPGLFEKASGIANGILSRLKAAFDIHSPSRETRKIFQHVMKGAELGLKDEESNLYSQTDDIAENVMEGFEGIDCSAYVRRIQDLIAGRQEAMIPTQVRYKNATAVASVESGDQYDADSGIDYDKMGAVVKKALNGVKVAIDGRTAGEIMTPYIDRNMGIEEERRIRG